MNSSPSVRLRIVLWALALILPFAAWEATNLASATLHLPIGVFFLAAVVNRGGEPGVHQVPRHAGPHDAGPDPANPCLSRCNRRQRHRV